MAVRPCSPFRLFALYACRILLPHASRPSARASGCPSPRAPFLGRLWAGGGGTSHLLHGGPVAHHDISCRRGWRSPTGTSHRVRSAGRRRSQSGRRSPIDGRPFRSRPGRTRDRRRTAAGWGIRGRATRTCIHRGAGTPPARLVLIAPGAAPRDVRAIKSNFHSVKQSASVQSSRGAGASGLRERDPDAYPSAPSIIGRGLLRRSTAHVI